MQLIKNFLPFFLKKTCISWKVFVNCNIFITLLNSLDMEKQVKLLFDNDQIRNFVNEMPLSATWWAIKLGGDLIYATSIEAEYFEVLKKHSDAVNGIINAKNINWWLF